MNKSKGDLHRGGGRSSASCARGIRTSVYSTEAQRINELTEKIIGAAIEVHKALGPGLLESVYEECLCYELVQRGLAFQRQRPLPVKYKEITLDCGYKLDLIVEGLVVLELKSVDRLIAIHDAQLLTYLKLLDCPVGLLINFNVPMLRTGIKRIVLNLVESRDVPAPEAVTESTGNSSHE